MAICIWNVAPSSSAKWNCLSNVTVASSRLLTLPRILVWVVECKCAWERLIIDFFSEQFRNDGLQKAWAWTVLTSLCLHFNSDFFSFHQGFSTAGKGNCCHALMGGKVNVVVFLVYKCSYFYAWSPWLRGAFLLPLGTNCCFSVLPLSEAAASVTKMWNILGWSVSWMWMRFWCALLKSKTNPILHSAWEFPLHWNETVKCSPACASPFSCCFGSWNV